MANPSTPVQPGQFTTVGWEPNPAWVAAPYSIQWQDLPEAAQPVPNMYATAAEVAAVQRQLERDQEEQQRRQWQMNYENEIRRLGRNPWRPAESIKTEFKPREPHEFPGA